MKKIILITSKFPYMGGEQFLETEIKYYCQNKNLSFTIMPISNDTASRELPSCITLDTTFTLTTSHSIPTRFFYLLKSLFNTFFYKELFSENLFSIQKMKYFFLAISRYQMFYEVFDNYFKQQNNLNETIIYTYWHNETTYALQSLKNKYGYKLISRIHRGDLYKEVQIDGYMPLKKHFTTNIDMIYTITESATAYLQERYGFHTKILKLSRLGVDTLKITTPASQKNTLSIVSCSSLIAVKRIDKIIESLMHLSKQMNHIHFVWNHIGGGVLKSKLQQLADKKLKSLNNIEFNFLGSLENKDVYKFYKDNPIDLFINVSDSEGVPVSIMEAMSCHIPIVAPDIGGIQDMLTNEYNGFLLSNESSISEIVSALSNISFFKEKQVRENSYQVFLNKYNAKENYQNFLQDILKL